MTTRVQAVQSLLVCKTDAELLQMGKDVQPVKDTADRIVSAAITEELIARNPQVMDAVNAWSSDLDADVDLIDVLAEALEVWA